MIYDPEESRKDVNQPLLRGDDESLSTGERPTEGRSGDRSLGGVITICNAQISSSLPCRCHREKGHNGAHFCSHGFEWRC